MTRVRDYINQYEKAAPLAVFRICFGLLMLISIIRFWANGWIKKLYLDPQFHFSYLGFEWVKPLGSATYLLFFICGLAALFVALGYKYRLAIIVFFLSFTYIELMDKTTYLNHYYFVSCMSFLLIFLPANASYSLDARLNKTIRSAYVPRFTIDTVKLLLGIVYFYAGLAKLNSDWLIKAQPLKTWLATKTTIPFIGTFVEQEWLAYAFSYIGAAYDLFIPFLLLYRKTRPFAFFTVLVFHLLTRVLFPIGMFPYIMIVSTLIFFPANIHERVLQFFSKILAYVFPWAIGQGRGARETYPGLSAEGRTRELATAFSLYKKLVLPVLSLFFAIQLLVPWRYLAYPGELFWTEQGYRFSWRVMLMEKAGYAQFKVVDAETQKSFIVNNANFLTPFQEKQMSFQPDFILEYAHHLHSYFEKQGIHNPEIYVESYVALNGRLSQPYIDRKTNLATQNRGFKPKTFILPFNDVIHGL